MLKRISLLCTLFAVVIAAGAQTTITWVLPNTGWTAQTGATINSVLATAITPTSLPDGTLKLTNVSAQALGGGLITYKLTFPSEYALPYVGLDFDEFISSGDLPILARNEFDIKISSPGAPNATTNVANIYDFSGQLNFSEGGMFQIDNAAATWADTGYKPVIAANTWEHFKVRYLMNPANGTYSVLSVAIGPSGTAVAPYAISSIMQNVPLQTSHWASTIAVQFQTEISQPGGLNTAYKNVTVTMSDSPNVTVSN